MSALKYLNSRETCALLNISLATLRRRLLGDAEFPQPVQTSVNGHRKWLESELVEWMESKRRAIA